MSVGDINSTAAGSGARYNDGKPDLSLIPIRIVANVAVRNDRSALNASFLRGALALDCLADFQTSHRTEHLYQALDELEDPLIKAAHVFTYGAKKYAAWNWAKGMAWSIPMACAARHALAMVRHEELDRIESGGSGLEHEGHLACNIIMLIFYHDHFPQGDDITYRAILPHEHSGAPAT